MNKPAIIKTVKELLRIAALGALAALVSYLTTKVASLPPNSAYALAGTLVLRLVDKYVHSNENISASGIVPF
jgi:hypothetical protein